ncbi:efflux RND transporter periplasmic adaptor subunit [Albirhodobacter sp. R86504]|uniref:efflux RND transporter periplasmic adaptor subunit n=1 Tax=Albirhodobacter sp. R86504 TaxID=3093848 RepID=UPI00366DB556
MNASLSMGKTGSDGRGPSTVALCVSLSAAIAFGWPGSVLAQDAPQALPVGVVTAERAPVIHLHEISGTIAAAETYTVGFRDGGKVIALEVEAGDHVEAGELIAKVDSVQADASARAASAGLVAAEASLRQAQLTFDRAEGLAKSGAGTQAGLDAARQSLFAARSARDQAETQLEKARQAQADTVIRADTMGIVTERFIEAGQIVGAAQPVVELARDGLREAVFYAPDTSDLEEIAARSVSLRMLDGTDIRLRAEISEIAPLADAQTGTVRVKARLSENERVPPLGTAVAGQVRWESAPVISLPANAIASSAEGPAVWVLDPQTSRVHMVPVVLARHEADTIAIASGVEIGELIVTNGSQLLYPDRLVRILEAEE